MLEKFNTFIQGFSRYPSIKYRILGRLFLFILFFGLFIAQESYSQKSATAVMQVSVRVVQGTSIDVKQPELISLSKNESSDLGQMSMKGINKENALVTVSNSLSVQDKEGNNIAVAVSSEYEENNERGMIYRLYGSPPDKTMKSGTYQGSLTTTIEYL